MVFSVYSASPDANIAFPFRPPTSPLTGKSVVKLPDILEYFAVNPWFSGSLREIFPEAVLYYSNKEEFHQCVKEIENNYEEVKAKVDEQWPVIKEKYSFETRARELVEIVEKHRTENSWLQ